MPISKDLCSLISPLILCWLSQSFSFSAQEGLPEAFIDPCERLKVVTEVARSDEAGPRSHSSTLVTLPNACADWRGHRTSGPCPCLWKLLVLWVGRPSQPSMKRVIETQKARTSLKQGFLKAEPTSLGRELQWSPRGKAFQVEDLASAEDWRLQTARPREGGEVGLVDSGKRRGGVGKASAWGGRGLGERGVERFAAGSRTAGSRTFQSGLQWLATTDATTAGSGEDYLF